MRCGGRKLPSATAFLGNVVLAAALQRPQASCRQSAQGEAAGADPPVSDRIPGECRPGRNPAAYATPLLQQESAANLNRIRAKCANQKEPVVGEGGDPPPRQRQHSWGMLSWVRGGFPPPRQRQDPDLMAT